MVNISDSQTCHKSSTYKKKDIKCRKMVSIEQNGIPEIPENVCPETIAAQLNTYCSMFEYFGWHAPLVLIAAARDELLKLSHQQVQNNPANAP